MFKHEAFLLGVEGGGLYEYLMRVKFYCSMLAVHNLEVFFDPMKYFISLKGWL